MTCPPRFGTPRSDRPTYGSGLREIAARLGVELMPWQADLADVALEHDGPALSYRDVAITVPRQSGKTTLMLAAIVQRMLAARNQQVAYGAQTRIAARKKLFDVLWPMIVGSELRELFLPPYRAMGSEALRAKNGSMLSIMSTEESAGHGDTLDFAVLDECWALTKVAEQAVRPAMATRKNAQVWMLSTAGTAKSLWWRSKIEAGRVAAQTGVGRLAYFEWSCDPDVDALDPANWPSFMPALNRTITPDVVQADLDVMEVGEWRRAYANQWPDESAEGWAVISEDVWGASAI